MTQCCLPVMAYMAATLSVLGLSSAIAESPRVMIVRDGRAMLPIVVGSVREPTDELHRRLQQISGADLERVDNASSPHPNGAVYVGLLQDFPWLTVANPEGFGPEGFVLQSDGAGVYLVAREPLGVQHAVTTFLAGLGCRWFFPGDAWEVIPHVPTIAGSWDERHVPSFPTQRRIWYGFGAYPQGRRDWEAWCRRNRMGGPREIHIGHTWHGLDPDKDFAAHPEWFAEVDGRRQPTKPCYSHSEVRRRAIAFALEQVAAGERVISMSPPDGLGYCRCEQCRMALAGGEPFEEHSTLFAKRPDGSVVNITSETLFDFVNEVAAAVAEENPTALVACYAYSAYSHPPSFDLHPNVYLQTTTAFRRTPLSLEEQIELLGKRTHQVGIREYYSVYQWDWDYPDPGKVTPGQLQQDLRFFHENGVTAINAEAGNNWAPRGLGYYVAAQLLWDVDAEVRGILRDFYERAFGPAAGPIERYYVRWYGPSAAGLSEELPERQVYFEDGRHNLETLRTAYRDLDEAARIVADEPAYLRRVDQLRMYAHYLLLRHRLEEAAESGQRERVLAAIRDETVYGGRLTNTHMIHTRPLLGKAFLRRFRAFEPLLANVPEAQPDGAWRQIGDAPSRQELERIWAEDKRALGL